MKIKGRSKLKKAIHLILGAFVIMTTYLILYLISRMFSCLAGVEDVSTFDNLIGIPILVVAIIVVVIFSLIGLYIFAMYIGDKLFDFMASIVLYDKYKKKQKRKRR